MRGSFVDLLRGHCLSAKALSTTIELVVYNKKRNHNGGHDDFLLTCNIGYKKHYCRSHTYGIETKVFPEKF